MKSTLNCSGKEGDTFPCLMKSSVSGAIYLMRSYKDGTCVYSTEHSHSLKLGDKVVNLGKFSIYTGPVFLEG